MANTYTLISSVTVGSGGSSAISFTSIPSTYTDILIKYSMRDTAADVGRNAKITLNGTSANQAQRSLYTGDSSTVNSYTYTDFYIWYPGSAATASTFGNSEVYIPNYASSNYKSFESDVTTENNGTAAELVLSASLWSDTAAISSVTATANGGTFAQYSTAYLYGISNA
jgi:hypothetical protein